MFAFFIACVSLTNPENGIVLTVDGTEYLKTAQYSCDQGYKISGVSTRTCSALGTWTASAPTCIILGKNLIHIFPLNQINKFTIY